jgi:Response regulator receiver domain/DinB superfamily
VFGGVVSLLADKLRARTSQGEGGLAMAEKNRTAKVLIADHHALVRAGLEALLGGREHIDIVGRAADGGEAVAMAARLEPDVVLIDLSMPHLDGVEATRRIVALVPGTQVPGHPHRGDPRGHPPRAPESAPGSRQQKDLDPLTGRKSSSCSPTGRRPARLCGCVLGRVRSSVVTRQESEIVCEMLERPALHREMEAARRSFHALLHGATREDLRRATLGTRWTNEQLLYHMLFGYLIVRTLLPLVRVMGRLPGDPSRVLARVLNAVTRPFHVVNYLGSCGGALVVRGNRAMTKMDRTIAALHRQLDRESDASLRRGMHFPARWDPYFRDVMTLAEVYHFGTQHFEHHRAQLTLTARD